MWWGQIKMKKTGFHMKCRAWLPPPPRGREGFPRGVQGQMNAVRLTEAL